MIQNNDTVNNQSTNVSRSEIDDSHTVDGQGDETTATQGPQYWRKKATVLKTQNSK